MVQFLSINFFLVFLQFLLCFSKVPVFLCHPVRHGDNSVRGVRVDVVGRFPQGDFLLPKYQTLSRHTLLCNSTKATRTYDLPKVDFYETHTSLTD